MGYAHNRHTVFLGQDRSFVYAHRHCRNTHSAAAIDDPGPALVLVCAGSGRRQKVATFSLFCIPHQAHHTVRIDALTAGIHKMMRNHRRDVVATADGRHDLGRQHFEMGGRTGYVVVNTTEFRHNELPHSKHLEICRYPPRLVGTLTQSIYKIHS